jgi:type IV pilus assembly protein PilM
MALNILKRDTGLVGLDFGYSGLKLLQLTGGDPPAILRMGFIRFPDAIRDDVDARLHQARQQLPKLLAKLQLKGTRAVCSIPAALTVVQHVQTPRVEGAELERQVRERFLQAVPCDLNGVVLRHFVVPPESRGNQGQQEVVCMAVSRDVVMKLVGLIKSCRLVPAAMHVEPLALVRAFDHITKRAEDSEITTLYLDVAAQGTRIIVAHGRDLVFSKMVNIGGTAFDKRACEQVGGSLELAHRHRLRADQVTAEPGAAASNQGTSRQAVAAQARGQAGGQAGGAPIEADARATAVADERRQGQLPPEMQSLEGVAGVAENDSLSIDLTDLWDTLADEISMCIRYHQSAYPSRRIDRAIFLGGESTNVDLCQHIARTLRLRAHLGDPLARLSRHPDLLVEGVPESHAYPGWAVPLGLCVSPTDL